MSAKINIEDFQFARKKTNKQETKTKTKLSTWKARCVPSPFPVPYGNSQRASDPDTRLICTKTVTGWTKQIANTSEERECICVQNTCCCRALSLSGGQEK